MTIIVPTLERIIPTQDHSTPYQTRSRTLARKDAERSREAVAACPLFTLLPSELRDRIYQYVFADAVIGAAGGQTYWEPHLEILQTCRLISEEARPLCGHIHLVDGLNYKVRETHLKLLPTATQNAISRITAIDSTHWSHHPAKSLKGLLPSQFRTLTISHRRTLNWVDAKRAVEGLGLGLDIDWPFIGNPDQFNNEMRRTRSGHYNGALTHFVKAQSSNPTDYFSAHFNRLRSGRDRITVHFFACFDFLHYNSTLKGGPRMVSLSDHAHHF